MLNAFGIVVALLMSTAQVPQCKSGEVLGVEHGRDYILNVCGVGLVALRGVEPPLRTARIVRPPIGGGELLGERDAGVIREGGPADFFLVHGDPLGDRGAHPVIGLLLNGLITESYGLLGADASIAAGPTGRHASAGTDAEGSCIENFAIASSTACAIGCRRAAADSGCGLRNAVIKPVIDVSMPSKNDCSFAGSPSSTVSTRL